MLAEFLPSSAAAAAPESVRIEVNGAPRDGEEEESSAAMLAPPDGLPVGSA